MSCSSCGTLASCPTCVERYRANVIAELPAFPCGWAEPTVQTYKLVALWVTVEWELSFGEDEPCIVVMTPDEARGIAKRFLQLADEAERKGLER